MICDMDQTELLDGHGHSFSGMVPRIGAPLDPAFKPMILSVEHHHLPRASGEEGELVVIGLERKNECVCRYATRVYMADGRYPVEAYDYIERLVKFLLWSRGAWKIYFGGPGEICKYVSDLYRPEGGRAFDAMLMGHVYDHPFTCEITAPENIPPCMTQAAPLPGRLNGCRIGFDLGRETIKLVAVQDGRTVYSATVPWRPSQTSAPEDHLRLLTHSLQTAASYLPRLDVIGGSAAGIVIDNRIKASSMFETHPLNIVQMIAPLFSSIEQTFGVPLVMLNDGEVNALAASLALGAHSLFAIGMLSNQSVGYIDDKRRITGWLNELAFAPLDANPAAAMDAWSGDKGVGGSYLSLCAVRRLLPTAGLTYPATMPADELMGALRHEIESGHEGARMLFETIGVYLGYTIPYYALFYDFNQVLVLGAAMDGVAGDLVIETARRVLEEEFPQLNEKVTTSVPDEKSRNIGQTLAAAGLPVLDSV